MFDKIKDLAKLKQTQDKIKKQLEQIFVNSEKGNVSVLVRGDKRVEKIIINGEENKLLKDLLNDSFKEVDKKVEKQMRGQLSDLGLPGF